MTNPLDLEVDSAEHVAAGLEEASRWIAKDQLGATDDCGFSPFSLDVKPKHGSPDFAREVVMKKIKARVEGARLASERLGCLIVREQERLSWGVCETGVFRIEVEIVAIFDFGERPRCNVIRNIPSFLGTSCSNRESNQWLLALKAR